MMKLLQSLVTASLAVGLISCGAMVEPESSSMSAQYSKKIAQQVGLWQVIAPGGLNCRTDAGVQFPSVYGVLDSSTFLNGLSSGAAGIYDSKLDSSGRLWMHVVPRSNVEHTPCYVLAEDRYIKPFVTKTSSLGAIEGDLSCQVEVPRSETYVYLESQHNRIYLCSYGPKLVYLSYDKASNSGKPSLKIVANLDESLDTASLATATEARFKNGSYTYSLSFPTNAQFPVANLRVTQADVEFPVLLDTPALAFSR